MPIKEQEHDWTEMSRHYEYDVLYILMYLGLKKSYYIVTGTQLLGYMANHL